MARAARTAAPSGGGRARIAQQPHDRAQTVGLEHAVPALATYMGHVNIASTQIYIQATPELQDCVNQRLLSYARGHGILGGPTR